MTGLSQSRVLIALLAGMCCAAPANLHASAPPSRQQQTTYSPSPTAVPGLSDMAVQPNGVVYIAGGSELGPFVSRIESNGTVAWTSYDNLGQGVANFGPLAVDPDGNTYLTLNDFMGPIQQAVIVKYSPLGTRLGEARPVSPNPGSPIGSNGIAIDPIRGALYVSLEYLLPDGKFAIVVIQYDLNLLEVRRNVYTVPPPSGFLGARGFGGIFVSTTGNVTLAGFDMPADNTIQVVLLRYAPDLAARVVEHPGHRNPQRSQSNPFGGMHTFMQQPSGSFIYRKIAPELGPILPNPGFGSFVGVGPDEETYFSRSFRSRQAQRFDAGGTAVWSPPLATDADKSEVAFARVSSPTVNLYLVGTFSGGIYLDRYGAGQQQGFLTILSGAVQVGNVNQPLPIPLEVLARNASSVPVSGVMVNFSISSVPANSQGQALSVPSQTTGPDGKASTIFTLGILPVEYEVQAAASASTVTFQACGKLANDDFEQFDTRWSATTYDNTSSSMGAAGCATSSLATLNNFYRNSVSPAIPQIDPDALNRSLRALGSAGYDGRGRVQWRGLSILTNGAIRFVSLVDVSATRTIQDVTEAADADLRLGHPVVMKVSRLRANGTSGEHFVLAVGKCRGQYIIADPGSGTRTQFDPNDANFQLLGIRTYAP